MKNLRTLGLILLLTSGPAAAQDPSTVVDALDGVDPVVLLQTNKEVFGKSEFNSVRGRFRYLFSTAETKATFEKEPAKYEIALSGLCARMGKTVYGNPSDYFIHDGRIYIFGSDDCHKRFAAEPARYIPKPAAPMPDSAAAKAKGRELIDAVVAKLGGAAKLDAVTSYTESITQIQKRPQGEFKVTTKTMYRFPGDVRVERTNQRPDGQSFTFATVLTPTDAFSASQGRSFPIIAAGRPSLEMDYGRHPLALLKARNGKQFVAAAAGPTTLDGVTVEQVRVKNGAVDVTLNVEPKSGQLHSIAFDDRGGDGAYGHFVLALADFRNVNGLMLPYETRATFNGQPDQFLTATVQTIEVNVPLDAALFTKPPTESK
jgi:YHS domain-containing protein